MNSNPPREIQSSTLSNGLIVVTERMPHVRSVSIGTWIPSGSRLERGEERGIAHFLEHMLFKGTHTRSAEDIARAVDSVGGHLDAFTSKELVSYNTKVLDEHLPIAWDILSDLILNPTFDATELEKEKSVILEELKMELDNPEYLVHELFVKNLWKGHGLGQPIIGTKQTIADFNREMLVDYHQRIYHPGNIVVTAAGNLEHDAIVNLVGASFANRSAGAKLPTPAKPKLQAPFILKQKRTQQAHLYIGAPSHPIAHETRFISYVLNTILGGGMSSRLFQNIRERQGLVYAVMSDLLLYRDSGAIAIYAGASAEALPKVISSVMEEFRDLKANPVPAEELHRAKEHLKGSLMLSLESTNSRMTNLARQQVFFGRFFSMDEMIENIEAVTAAQVQSLANESFLSEKLALTVLGKVDGLALDRALLNC
ncbi:M16 family metallopeptidase [Bryobacter aggregatus]|uniref:M16 family metallopeptidase n=1 Tax=Bryobacter aggregatus TaxID=360054 RepID=UPI0004E1E814|nr:pitrilysin family protein [Bryobacter aggregatus]